MRLQAAPLVAAGVAQALPLRQRVQAPAAGRQLSAQAPETEAALIQTAMLSWSRPAASAARCAACKCRCIASWRHLSFLIQRSEKRHGADVSVPERTVINSKPISTDLDLWLLQDLSPEAAKGCVDIGRCAMGFVVLALVGIIGLLPAIQLLIPGLLRNRMRSKFCPMRLV